MELQEQLQSLNKDLTAVKIRLTSLQRESRVNSMTSHHIQGLGEEVPLYRSVGKAFFAMNKNQLEATIEQEISENTKAQRELLGRQEFLERRIASITQNIQDLYN
jgi:chaperonin cofactor prefoldin